MIVLRDKPGQLCNRIWSAGLFLSICKQNNIRLFAPYHFTEYLGIFEKLERDRRFKLRIGSGKKPNKWLEAVIRFCELSARKGKYLLRPFNFYWVKEDIALDELLDLSRKGVVFIDSFKFFYYNIGKLPFEEAEFVKSFFQIKQSIRERVLIHLSEFRDKNKVLAGIHIRRGDYATYRNGRYYFDDLVYVDKMKQLEAILQKEGRAVQFLICSDSQINQSAFDGFDWFGIPDASAAEDLTALSCCDLIMGPPSTFSEWAAFSGNVSLFIIDDEDCVVSTDSFKKLVNVHFFTDGSCFEHHLKLKSNEV